MRFQREDLLDEDKLGLLTLDEVLGRINGGGPMEVSYQVAYDWIEDADSESKELRRFYDFLWDKHRDKMREFIIEFADGPGEALFYEYIHAQ